MFVGGNKNKYDFEHVDLHVIFYFLLFGWQEFSTHGSVAAFNYK